jgi:predicted DCC family thiol-disulfide oxidoreductase YuxK
MTHQVEMFHDGDCPLCQMEVKLLRRMSRKNGRILFTDVSSPDFDADAHGKTQAEFMARIQARRANGEWLDGVEVFRALYGALGLGWLMQVTRIWGVSHLLEFGYDIFARNRLRLTGRTEQCAAEMCRPNPQV